MAVSHVARVVDRQLAQALERFPAVLVTGARAVGKTTTAQRFARSVVRLDQRRDAEAFHADPDVALAHLQPPVLLDEWQAVPEVLGAVKRAVDADASPGRFVLTGSVRANIDVPTWPGTGRLIRIRMDPMTLAERVRGDLDASRAVIDALFEQGSQPLLGRRCDLALDDYLEAALAGGWPQLLGRDAQERDMWLESYIDQTVTRALHASGCRVVSRRRPMKARRCVRCPGG